MCFYIDSKHPNKKKAKKDITCYKILFKTWRSIVQGFKYVPRETYLDNNALNIVEDLTLYIKTIYRGYHSFSSKEMALLSAKQAVKRGGLMIVKCIIPEGSDYYYNSQFHEYVSNSIKIIDIIK